MSPIDGIDIERGLRLSLADEDFYAEMLGIFLESQERSREEIEAALSEGRRNDALRIAHTVKGEAANIGAEELRDRAGACEAALRENRESELPAAIERFGSSLALAAKGIRAFFATRGPA
jgi:HPt (histidine-containing phosphotransfer) domain-containing protein